MRLVLLFVILAASLAGTSEAWAAVPGCEARAIRAQQVLIGADLENWAPVNDRTVLIWSGHSTRAALVRLAQPLDGLTTVAVINLVDGDHDGSISPCGHDGITLASGPDDGRIVRIVSIQLLSEKRTAELDPGARIATAELTTV